MASHFTLTPEKMAEEAAVRENRHIVDAIEKELRAQLKAQFTEAAEPLILEAVEAAMHNMKVRATAFYEAQFYEHQLNILTTIKVES